MSRLMDTDELARYLKLEKQTIYNWLHQKKISGIKVGHVWRFDKKAIDKWLDSNLVEARRQRPEDRSQKTEARRQKSEM